LPKSCSLSIVFAIVSTRRLRDSSGAIVSKTCASRAVALPSRESAVASSCATFSSSNAAVML